MQGVLDLYEEVVEELGERLREGKEEGYLDRFEDKEVDVFEEIRKEEEEIAELRRYVEARAGGTKLISRCCRN
jgi:hypothetical protein